jgi:hypothetical protein
MSPEKKTTGVPKNPMVYHPEPPYFWDPQLTSASQEEAVL